MSALHNDHISAALDFVRANGLLVDSIVFDGALHRVPTADKPHAKDGAYRAHADAPASVWFLNWRTGVSDVWTAKEQGAWTKAERQAHAQRMEENRKAREAEQARVHAEAATKAQAIYAAAAACDSHPYLTAKGVTAVPGLKLHKVALVVPVYDEEGKIVSLQFIGEDGGKKFLTGGRKRGCFFAIGKDASKPLHIAEGLATALSIYEATGNPAKGIERELSLTLFNWC